MKQHDIYLTDKHYTEPIHVVYGSSAMGIALNVVDYSIPAGATAVAHARNKNAEKTFENPCTIANNKITLIPNTGFFLPGYNLLQIVISIGNGEILSFTADVHCEPDITEGASPTTPEAVRPLLERAEAAAKAAESSKDQAGTSAANAANSRAEAAKSEKNSGDNAAAAAKSAQEASTAEKKAMGYRDAAKGFADTAAGYAGAAAVSIGWDADGYFSIFETEED